MVNTCWQGVDPMSQMASEDQLEAVQCMPLQSRVGLANAEKLQG